MPLKRKRAQVAVMPCGTWMHFGAQSHHSVAVRATNDYCEKLSKVFSIHSAYNHLEQNSLNSRAQLFVLHASMPAAPE